ncbi:MAG: ATP-binding protein [Thermoleophilia bacterium]
MGAANAWVLRTGTEGTEVAGFWTPAGAPLATGREVTPAELGTALGAAIANGVPADGRFDADDSPLCGPAGCFSAMPILVEGAVWGVIGMTDGMRVTNVRNRGHLRAFCETAGGILTTLLARAERDEMEGELRHAQKLEAVGQLAAGIAHEINTPIQFVGDSVEFLRDAFDDMRGLLEQYRALAETAATGTAEALAEKLEEADDEADLEYLLEQVPKAIERTLDGAGRVAEIVRAMKEFAHPRRDSQAPADLNRAIQSTATVARNELKYVADVSFELADLPPVVCHLGDVNQVVLNLMVNASHAIADRISAGDIERGAITVSTKLSDDAQWVTISVADTGGGIPEDVRERIFEPFFTTKEVGKGTGQGLAIAARVCEAHGGSLSFETELGEGTTFHLRLPVDGTGEPLELPA